MTNPASTVPEYWDRYADGVNADTALDGGPSGGRSGTTMGPDVNYSRSRPRRWSWGVVWGRGRRVGL